MEMKLFIICKVGEKVKKNNINGNRVTGKDPNPAEVEGASKNRF